MLVPHDTHIMVIDGANKSLFRNRGKDFSPVLERIDETSRHTGRTSDLGSDRPGRSSQSMGGASSGLETTDNHQAEEDRFANEAADQMNTLLSAGGSAILIATPHVLGVMRKRLTPESRSRITAEIDKDYAQRSIEDITELLVSL